MASLNLAVLVGNLGRDPEIRHTNGGRQVATLSVATSERYKDASGDWKEETEWHRVVVWQEGLVDFIQKRAQKGAVVLVMGKVRTRKWKDQQDVERYSTEIVVQGFMSNLQIIAGGKRTDDSDTSERSERPRAVSRSSARPTSLADDLDDEIPFAFVLPTLISIGSALLGMA